jgi:WD40 repeat protein
MCVCLLALASTVFAEDYRILPNVGKVKKHGYQFIDYSPDGRFVAAAGGVSPRNHIKPGKLTIWDARSGEIMFHQQDFPSTCRSVRFAPDGQTLAVLSADFVTRRDAVYLTRLTTERKRAVWSAPVSLPSMGVWAPQSPRYNLRARWFRGELCFSPSGASLVHLQSWVRVNDVGTSLRLANHWKKGEEDPATLRFEQPENLGSAGFRFLTDEQLLLSTTRNPLDRQPERLLQVVELASGKIVREVPLAKREQGLQEGGIQMSADGRWIAVSYRYSVQILRREDLEPFRMIDTGLHGSISLSPNGEILATGYTSGDGSVHFWDVQTGEELASRSHERSYSTDIDFSPDGKFLASLDLEGGIRLWDMEQLLPGRELSVARTEE